MKKSPLSITIAGLLLSTNTFAAGLFLSQIGTAESVATAGASGVTNNRDSSAVITNAAGLSGIEKSSAILGLQYLDVKSEFERDGGGSTIGESGMFMPHLSYAQRLNEEWVVGMAVHSAGGLGMDYSNGLNGGPVGSALVETSMLGIVNLTTSAAYQINEQLSVGASLIAQYAMVETEFAFGNANIEEGSWAPAIAFSAMYQLSGTAHFGLTYNSGNKHEIEVYQATKVGFNWPQMVELGVQHQLSDDLAIMANVNWQQWSAFLDGYEDTFGAGVALSYQLSDWTLQTGASMDSSPVNSDNRGHALPLDQQWRIGLGGHKTLGNGMVLGLAYQYQSLGDAEITGTVAGINDGAYSKNRVHFITGSLSF